MSRIVFYGLPVAGHMNPALGVVQELVQRGHDVRSYATAAWAERIEAVGAIPLRYDDPSLDAMEPPENSLVMLSLALRVAQTVLPGLIRDIERTPAPSRPDLLMVDSTAPWGVIVARRTGLPSVTSSTTFAINGPVARKVNGDLTRLLPMLWRGGGALVDAMRRRGQLRRAWGVEPPDLPEIVGAPADQTIAYTSRSFQPLSHTFGPDTHFVGPVLSARREAWDDPLPPGFLYVSLGTLYHRNPEFFRTAIDATRDLGQHVLLNIGTQLDPTEFRNAPAHVRVVRGAPQLAVLGRAGGFVTHGGMNSVHESLLAGVPMVVVPQAVDQFLVGDRVADVGAGIALDPRRLTAERLCSAIDTILTDPAYTAAADRVGDDLRSAGGAARAADVMETLLEQRSTRRMADVH